MTSALTEVQLVLFESLKFIQVESSDPDQSLPVVVFKSGMSSTSSQDLVLSETDLTLYYLTRVNPKVVDKSVKNDRKWFTTLLLRSKPS